MRGNGFIWLLLLFPLAAHAQQFGGHTRVRTPVEGDLYASGGTVELLSAVSGDAVLAGRKITVDAPVAQDLMAAGDLVDVASRIGDDLRAAGRSVRLNADIADHFVAAGATVTIMPNARVGSFAWLAGREVVIEGEIGGPLKAAGESVRIGGHVAGDAEIWADDIELLPSARIDGNLHWRGGQLRVAGDARIGGRLVGEPVAEHETYRVLQSPWVAALLVIAPFAVTGVVLYLLFPHAAARAAAEVRRRPGINAVLGFGVLVFAPIVVVALFVTGVGWLLGLLLLLLYLAAITSAGLIGTFALSEMGLAAVGKGGAGKSLRAATLACVIAASVALLQTFPALGGLLALLLLLWGLGSIAQLMFGSHRGFSEPGTTEPRVP